MPELTNTRFGTLEFNEEDVIRFTEGLSGCDQGQRFDEQLRAERQRVSQNLEILEKIDAMRYRTVAFQGGSR